MKTYIRLFILFSFLFSSSYFYGQCSLEVFKDIELAEKFENTDTTICNTNLPLEVYVSCKNCNPTYTIVLENTTVEKVVNETETYAMFTLNEEDDYIFSIKDDISCTANLNLKVSQVTVGGHQTMDTTCGLDNGSVSFTPSGGTEPYILILTNAGVTIPSSSEQYMYTNLASSDYDVEIMDDNGCKDSTPIEINSSMPMEFSLDPKSSTCGGNNGEIHINKITGTSPFKIELNGSTYIETTSSLDPILGLNAGLYKVIITDSDNCSVMQEATIDNIVSNIVANAGDDVVIDCNNSSVKLGIESNNQENITYEWTGAGINNTNKNHPNPIVKEPGIYTLTVSDDDGCTDTADVEVENDRIAPSANAGLAQPITCDRPNITLGSQENTGVNYQWEGASINNSNRTQANPEVSQADTYRVTVTDTNNGCSNIGEVIISGSTTRPVANASVDHNILNCIQTQVTLQAQDVDPSARYEWFREDGTLYRMAPSVATTTAGTYTLVVTNTTNNCSDDSKVTIDVNKSTPEVSTNGNKTLTCDNPTATLTGSVSGQADEVYWLTPNGTRINTISITADQIGTHTFYAINKTSGCQANTSLLISGETAMPTADTGPSQTLNCNISMVTLGASPLANHTYQWSGPNGFTSDMEQPDVEVMGEYFLTVTNNSSGCSANNMVTIIEDIVTPSAAISSDFNILTCSNTIVELTALNSNEGDFSYDWRRTDGSLAGSAQVITATQADTYSLTVTNTDNGCSASNSITIGEDKATPSVDAGTDIEITCNNSIAALNGIVSGKADSIFWTNEAGEQIAEMAQTDIGIKGTYTITAFNTDNGCSTKDQVIVSGNADIPEVNVGTTPMELNCTIESVLIGEEAVEDNLSYTWIKEGDNEIISVNSFHTVADSGTYILTVSNAVNQCSASGFITITKNVNPPDLESHIASIATLCEGEPATLSLPANFIVTWTEGLIGNEREVDLISGQKYSLSVINDKNQCPNDTSFTVRSIPKPKPDENLGIYLLMPGDLLFIPNDTFDYKWGWKDEDGIIDYDSNKPTERTYLLVDDFDSKKSDIDFFVEIYNKGTENCSVIREYYDGTPNGFVSTENEEQRIIYNEDYFNNLQQTLGKQDKINAFPNPTNGIFNIELYGEYRGSIGVVVYNEIGKRIFKDQLFKEAPYLIKPIDFSLHKNGIYLIHLIDDQGEISTIKTLVNH